MAMDKADLNNRFTYHAPVTPETADAHTAVRARCSELAHWLNTVCPDGRELALAITSLEGVMTWANAAIARHGGPAVPVAKVDRYGNHIEDDGFAGLEGYLEVPAHDTMA